MQHEFLSWNNEALPYQAFKKEHVKKTSLYLVVDFSLFKLWQQINTKTKNNTIKQTTPNSPTTLFLRLNFKSQHAT